MPHTENEEQYIEDRIEYVLKNQEVPTPLIKQYIDDIISFDDLHPYNIMTDEDIINDFNLWYEED
jgi:transcription termination factor NusB